MAQGEKPAFKIITKDDSPNAPFAWKYIGALWLKDNGKEFSGNIELPDGTKLKIQVVVNKQPKAKEEPELKPIDDGAAIPF